MYSKSDISEMEASIKAILPPDTLYGRGYYQQPIALYLWNAWDTDHTDLRIITYSLPIIENLMVKYRNLLAGYENMETFNTLCLHMMTKLKCYNPSKGSLFSFLTNITEYRILDFNKPARDRMKREKAGKVVYAEFQLDESVESEGVGVDDATHLLADFTGFLGKLKPVCGETENTVIDSLVALIRDDQHICNHNYWLLQRLRDRSHLPMTEVRPIYTNIVNRYLKSDLPY